MRVHGALRAGRSSPTSRARTRCRRRASVRPAAARAGCCGQQRVEDRARRRPAAPAGPRHDDVLHFVRRARHRLRQRRQQRAGHDERLRAAVLQHVRVVVDGEQRVDRTGTTPACSAPRNATGKSTVSCRQTQHPLLAADAQRASARAIRRDAVARARRRSASARRRRTRPCAARPALRASTCCAKLKRAGGGAPGGSHASSLRCRRSTADGGRRRGAIARRAFRSATLVQWNSRCQAFELH